MSHRNFRTIAVFGCGTIGASWAGLFAARGLKVGPGADVEIISCNNERPVWQSQTHRPATLDIRADAIARRGIELLLWRINHRSASGRVSILIEPNVIESERAVLG